MTILLASADHNLIASARTAFAAAGSDCVVAHTGIECVDTVFRLVPDLVILDQFLPWGGADGVLAILDESSVAWVEEIPILVLTTNAQPYVFHRLRIYPFVRSCCGRKLAEVVEMFESEHVDPARTA